MTKQPIVPLAQLPISRKFEKKAKSTLIFRCKVRELNFSFYTAISSEQAIAILDKVLSYDH